MNLDHNSGTLFNNVADFCLYAKLVQTNKTTLTKQKKILVHHFQLFKDYRELTLDIMDLLYCHTIP